jgi:hypothetical protein
MGSRSVRRNCLTPGPTADTQGIRRLAPTAEAEDRIRATVPLRRFGSKDELADLALFLCSDAATYITGLHLCATVAIHWLAGETCNWHKVREQKQFRGSGSVLVREVLQRGFVELRFASFSK